MAEANPNIILGVKPIDMPNPLESATKALTMSNLMQEHQSNTIKLTEEQRQASDRQTLRDAFKNNTTSDPQGNPVMNRQGIMGDLMKANPMLAQKQALDFKQMDLDNLSRQHQISKSILFDITPGDQASLERAKAQAQQNGLPPLDGVLPKDANDPNFGSALRNAQMKSLTAEEQLAQANKQQEFAMQKQKNDVEVARLQHDISQHNSDKKMEANNQVQGAIEGSRQTQDAKQAFSDIQNSTKINGLLEQARDPKTGKLDYNLLDNQQVHVLYGEVGKVAQGGAPTEGGLKGMTPETAKSILADYKSLATNKPQPAELGAFVKKMKAYTDELADQGKTLLRDRENRIIDQRKNDLGDENYKNYKAGVEKSYGKDGGGGGDMVAVKLPNDQTGNIPRANLAKAQSRGAKLISSVGAAQPNVAKEE